MPKLLHTLEHCLYTCLQINTTMRQAFVIYTFPELMPYMLAFIQMIEATFTVGYDNVRYNICLLYTL